MTTASHPNPAGFVPFRADSMMWRVNRERVVLLGGPLAAVLQAAHPVVARGVAGHSRFRSDSTGRLRRTLEAVYTVAFGTAEEVGRMREGIARAHAPVRGPGYSAFDPEAQQWVMATLIMGSVSIYERFVAALSEEEKNRLLEENRRFGEVFGLAPASLPPDWSAFLTYWESMMDGALLGSDPLCGEVARAVIRPDAPWGMRLASPLIRALTVGYLPGPLANRLGIEPGVAGDPVWRLLDLALPRLLAMAPDSWRYERRYLAARDRSDSTGSAR